MRNRVFSRLVAFLLAFCLLAGYAVPAQAASVGWREVDIDAPIPDLTERQANYDIPDTGYQDTDMVRVSIVLDEKSTVQAGYATMGIARNPQAVAYQIGLKASQDAMAQTISTQVLGGAELDVEWNLTLVGNIISANVPYGKLEEIRQLPGVKEAVVEQRYEPQTTEEATVAEPQTYISSGMTGAGVAWTEGYTGAGSRVGIIDTGTDVDHQSFDNGAFLYALKENAKEAGISEDKYLESLHLLDLEEVKAVLPQLNVHERSPEVTAEELYLTEKLPFGYNYVDKNLKITHDYDTFGGHGSHVAGITAANRYIPNGEGQYVSAADKVYVNGAAPDAQIITLKVAGVNGGIYESDYMAAIEDAILLGCDAVNLSLGSNMPGDAYSDTYAELLDYLTTTDTVVVISAGNSSHWAARAATGGYLYNDDVSYATGGSPGTYANSFTVASVDSAGAIGPNLLVDGNVLVYYESTGFGNEPMTTLDTTEDGSGTEYPFVYVDGFGTEADFAGIDLKGKVAFCSRGGGVNFGIKANNAVAQGAVAVAIYNNTTGLLGMNLTGYQYSAPCVSLTRDQANTIKNAATQAKTADGQVYYTGSLKISAKNAVGLYGGNYTMSSFSSWGVPGSLTLKPEITAPGGNILSVNGQVRNTDQYFYMSGTSMAAPQITGLTALMMQYFRETGLAEKAGVSPRVLAQSLLMSTADPLYEEASGGYYSLLNQGAGLARVDKAMDSASYILVDGQPDGKVKAELGDDPDRTGKYTFSFDIHNLTDEARSYTLSADLFTQDVFEKEGLSYLDTLTRYLAADVAFSSDGSLILSADDVQAYDLNGDGKTDALDADFLLEYLLGNETELKANGDVNGDGKINTFDAHVLLALVEDNICVTVPAGGSASVEVTLTLPEQVKEYLDKATPNGAYIEAFVYAETVEGEETHSIPVLGYYGGWTEPSMYDRGTTLEELYGLLDRSTYMGMSSPNLITIAYHDNGGEYIFGGNPLADEDAYLPQRNAFNNENGDELRQLYFTQIRNAGNSRFRIWNPETGEIYVLDELGRVMPAFYYTTAGVWQNQQLALDVKWAGTDADGKPLPDGTPVEVSLITAPEYYRNEDGTYDWDALGEGAYFTTQFTIDNTAPTLKNVDDSKFDTEGKLTITAQDEQYVAAVALLNTSGIRILASAVPNQTEAGKEVTVSLPITGTSGTKFLVAVYDYAMNATTYEVTLDLTGGAERPQFTAFNRTTKYDKSYYNWIGFDAGVAPEVRLGDMADNSIHAADFAGGYVFAVTEDNRFQVAEDIDLCNFVEITTLTSAEYPVKDFRDLAYNSKDGKLYGIYYSEANSQNVPYLCTIDLLNGDMTVLGELGQDMYSLTADDAGNFYGIGYGNGILYTFTVDTFDQPTTLGDLGTYSSRALNCLAWDHNEGKLYWAYCASSKTDLLEIDPQTASATLVRSLPFALVGLYILPDSYTPLFPETDSVYSVTLNRTEAKLLPGEALQLEASLLPWTLKDKSVVWSSSDEALATVNENGRVTAKAPGTVTITAAATQDSAKTAACTVEVVEIAKTLNGLVWDEDGAVWWSEFDTNKLSTYEKLTEKASAQRFAAAAYAPDGYLYAATLNTNTNTSDYYRVDPTDFSTVQLKGSDTIFYADLSYAPSMDCMVAVCNRYLVLLDGETGAYIGNWMWSSGASLVGIAYAGTQYNEESGTDVDSFFLINARGDIYLMGMGMVDGQYAYFRNEALALVKSLNISTDAKFCNSLYYDGQYLFWSRLNQAGGSSELIAWDYNDPDKVYRLGTFSKDVWPVCGLFQLDNNQVAQSLADLSQEQAVATASTEAIDLTPESVPTGGLQSTVLGEPQTRPEIQPNSTGSYDETQGTVTVAVTAGKESTNGRMTVSYDTDKLTLTGIASPLEASANKEADGSVEIAYASSKLLSESETLALLTFQVKNNATGDTEILLKTTELGNEAADAVETVTVSFACAHTPEVRNAREATCTQPGYTGDTYCKDCGELLEKGKEIAALGHDFSVKGETVAPTETEEGYTVYKCSRCDATEHRDIVPATGHKCASKVFTDLRVDQWYHPYTDYVIDNGLMNGVGNNKFNPNGETTRAMLVTTLYRMAGEPEVAELSTFTDVPANRWYARAVAWAQDTGIAKGVTDTAFAPNASVTREQAATFLYRYVTLYLKVEPVKGADLSVYKDAGKISGYAKEAIAWATAEGLFIGFENGTLQPRDTLTRIQLAKLLTIPDQKF
ncbi:MAG: S8 family serine peptidase [Faecousia sp.]